MIEAVAITGTRSTDHRTADEYAQLFADHLAPYASAHFHIGGALGIDTLALLWLAEHTTASITIVVPGRVDQQPAAARQAIEQVNIRIADVVELAAPELRSPAYHARNRWMVDRSAMTIGFPLAGTTKSGTWQTLTYTRDQGKPQLIVPV